MVSCVVFDLGFTTYDALQSNRIIGGKKGSICLLMARVELVELHVFYVSVLNLLVHLSRMHQKNMVLYYFYSILICKE